MNENISILVSSETLSLKNCSDFVKTAQSGGITVFEGTVRNHTKDKEVLKLDFEAYEPMAQNEMLKIAELAIKKWPVHKIAIHHRYGSLSIGETPVIIAVSSSHRGTAFEACEFCIDELKKTVPIWKKEFFADGEVWVAAHP
ncbi:MAG: molybdopterin synthase catalytic subunit [Flavobacteriales bacterium]|jgi:molybdopterin synthase catalytic subunit